VTYQAAAPPAAAPPPPSTVTRRVGLRTKADFVVHILRQFNEGSYKLGRNNHLVAWGLEFGDQIGDVARQIMSLPLRVAVLRPFGGAEVFSKGRRFAECLKGGIEIASVSNIG
jgi:hypothetical protein